MTAEERTIILASSAGTVFEWYDFYLALSLASEISDNFFTGLEPTAGFIFTLLTFAAGFAVRPFGALVFGNVGDLVGRKYTFLVTMLIMGAATFAVGLIPTYSQIGIVAPVIFIACRLLQGLALGGEYGGAATYVAEHAPQGRRGLYTSWIQTTATTGLFLSLLVILALRLSMPAEAFNTWGWRVPFLVSIILLAISLWIRFQLDESPAFRQMKEEGALSKGPLGEAFGTWAHAKWGLIALFGATAGQAVIWYAGQFYALYFLTKTLSMDSTTATLLLAISLVIGTPFFVFFGWLSDKIGRKPILMTGCALAALTYFPIFGMIAKIVNPGLVEAHQKVKVLVTADPATCGSVFDPVNVRAFTAPCDIARKALATASISYSQSAGVAGSGTTVTVDGKRVPVDAGFAEALKAAAIAAGYPEAGDARILRAQGMLTTLTDPRAQALIGLLALLVFYVTMVYGPIAAVLAELFPTRIRYSGMSLPYHIGNGWFGGFLPPTVFAIVAATGDIYSGLWYPVGVAAMTFVVGMLFLPETYRKDIFRD